MHLAVDGHHTHITLGWQRHTEPQHQQPDSAARWQNLANALTWPKQQALPTHTVCIIDDITTTGASLYYACQVLRRTGYTRPITALSLAYVPDPAIHHPDAPTTAYGECLPVTRLPDDPAFAALWPTPPDEKVQPPLRQPQHWQ
jgi:hypothetical protein